MADALLCDPINGGPVENNCTSIFVQGYMPSCMANATEVCAAAAAPFEAVSRAQGQMWGMYVSIVCDVIISIGLAWERCTLGKAAGILLSLGSAAFMVTYGQDLGGAGAVKTLVGNGLLFCNCLATALYVICEDL